MIFGRRDTEELHRLRDESGGEEDYSIRPRPEVLLGVLTRPDTIEGDSIARLAPEPVIVAAMEDDARDTLNQPGESAMILCPPRLLLTILLLDRRQLHLRAGHLEEAMAISKKVAAILEAITKQPRKRCKFDK